MLMNASIRLLEFLLNFVLADARRQRVRYGNSHVADGMCVAVETIRDLWDWLADQEISATEAKAFSGYSLKQLRRSARNLGTEGRPRFRLGDLPIKPAYAPRLPSLDLSRFVLGALMADVETPAPAPVSPGSAEGTSGNAAGKTLRRTENGLLEEIEDAPAVDATCVERGGPRAAPEHAPVLRPGRGAGKSSKQSIIARADVMASRPRRRRAAGGQAI